MDVLLRTEYGVMIDKKIVEVQSWNGKAVPYYSALDL
jgi:hypothetical protein